MGNLSSTVTESVTGTRSKQPLAPETAGVLGADWQQLAAKAARAENDMREVAEGAPAALAERDIQGAAADVIETAQRSRQKTNDRRCKQVTESRAMASQRSCRETNRHRRSKPAVFRVVTSPRSSSKSCNDIEMEF